MPSQVDCLQGVLTIIPMQLLALHIAELKKFDVSIRVTVSNRAVYFNQLSAFMKTVNDKP